jgi:hypothetical protein
MEGVKLGDERVGGSIVLVFLLQIILLVPSLISVDAFEVFAACNALM